MTAELGAGQASPTTQDRLHATGDPGHLPAIVDLVDGEWGTPAVDLGVALEDPATGAEVARAVATAPERIELALAVADQTSGVVTPDMLDAIADALEPRLARIAELDALATGVPLSQTSLLGVIVAGAFRLAAGQVRAGILREDRDGVRVHRLPLGPALCLVPWNAPAPMAAHKVANALAAGCPVILKVSELTPYSSILLAEAIAEQVPPGMFQLVHGGIATGTQLVADSRIRAVSFTGGLAGGRSVATASAPLLRPCQLELGGNNPLLVLPDADTDTAARMAAELLTTLNGQWCRALGRLILPADRAAELVEAIGKRLDALRFGPPLDPATEFGPLVHSRHVRTMREALSGRRFRSFGQVPETGNYLAPALLADDLTDEVFGPVAGMVTYESVDEAVRLANAVPYGLEGYVCGTDKDVALSVAQRIRAGEVKVNGSSIMSLHLMTPRPAWGWSGLGEEGTAETLRFFTGARVVGVEGRFALHTS
ncbi:aldehyde dehydrogenase family protein [Nocardia uniformis]|uniref:Aldehyde dehydrogenase family protein n=1 Tax=Nocardia uniformis TaxID=53432 RepID=A0A849C6B0_9NOCA|nr:aldehyde dehydrogenase family protein [Nocardia uniformis]NNH68501.1 aldehyde dehydrogenase family protein [Nocardia uniformis]